MYAAAAVVVLYHKRTLKTVRDQILEPRHTQTDCLPLYLFAVSILQPRGPEKLKLQPDYTVRSQRQRAENALLAYTTGSSSKGWGVKRELSSQPTLVAVGVAKGTTATASRCTRGSTWWKGGVAK